MTRPLQPKISLLFILNLLYVLVSLGMFLTGRFREGIVLLILYTLILSLYMLLWYLPNYLKAKKRFGSPVPPMDLQLGPVDSDVAAVLNTLKAVECKERHRFFGRPFTHTLFETDLETEDGLWWYRLETRDDHLVAYAFEFKSSHSKFMNFSKRVGSGTFLRTHPSG
jgi:hypothetical protein